MTATLAKLPSISVRAHPYGSKTQRDSHKEYFDQSTNFHKGLLDKVPVSFYHNWNPETGMPTGEPTAIGLALNPQFKEDGRWDDVEWFENVSPEIKDRIEKAIQKETLRASPSVVPDFHVVESDGHIKNWLTGSIAVFDAEGMRQPANQLAIALPQMKALYQEAGLTFPSQNQMKALALTSPLTSKLTEWKEKLDAWFNMMPTANGDNDEDLFNSVFGTDTKPETKVEDKSKTEDKKEGNDMADETKLQEIQLEYDNKMKAQNQKFAMLQRQLDESHLGNWFDRQLTAGRVLPAEKEMIVELALQLKGQVDNSHPTMKAKGADGKESEISLLDAFKLTIESRPNVMSFTPEQLNQLKAIKIQGEDTIAEERQKVVAEAQRILAMIPEGQAALASQNGNK